MLLGVFGSALRQIKALLEACLCFEGHDWMSWLLHVIVELLCLPDSKQQQDLSRAQMSCASPGLAT